MMPSSGRVTHGIEISPSVIFFFCNLAVAVPAGFLILCLYRSEIGRRIKSMKNHLKPVPFLFPTCYNTNVGVAVGRKRNCPFLPALTSVLNEL